MSLTLRLHGLTAILLMLCARSVSAAPMTAPDTLIKDVSVKILAALKGAANSYDREPERLHQQLDTVLAPIVNYDAIAKGVMAVHYKEATEAQRKRFVGVFRTGLIKSYARAMLTYANAKMELQPTEASATQSDRSTVRMKVTAADGNVYPLEYTMVKDPDGMWRIRNVIVYGINLGLQYRNIFASAMMDANTKGNIDKVIDGWTSVATPSAVTGGQGGAKAATVPAVGPAKATTKSVPEKPQAKNP